jgi:16S rRNA (cytosine1402-N4)-methyltransferase
MSARPQSAHPARPDTQLAFPGFASRADAETEEWILAEDYEPAATESTFVHETVMRSEIASLFDNGVVVDCTLGGGGHAEAILERSPSVRLVAFDRDENARAAAGARLLRFADRLTIVAAPFSEVRSELTRLGIHTVQGLYADLGVSSPQLDEAARGMSFRREGPIDMRMDMSSGETCLELIENSSDDELANIIFQYGDERRSRKIARSIKRASDEGELHTTLDLRRAVVRAVGPVRVGGVDPATRTFQALRIAVNRELEELENVLAALPAVLAPGATAAFISFHSLEDRLVKTTFKGGPFAPLTKKPLTATDEEKVHNARSRSAKLRIAHYDPDAAADGAPDSGEESL